MIPKIAAGAVFLWCAVVIARDDYQFRIVPDRILAVLFATGALYGLLAGDPLWEDLEDTISALAFRSAVPGLSTLLVALIYKVVRGRDGLGLGDIKLIAAAGVSAPGQWQLLCHRCGIDVRPRGHGCPRIMAETGSRPCRTRYRLRFFLRQLSGSYGSWMKRNFFRP